MTLPTEPASIPRHLGLILDGNRRWARDNGVPQLEGHRAGYQNLKTVGLAALDRGVEYVSAYVFSTENWNRSTEDVDYLMKLLLWVATKEVKDIHEKNVRIRFLGSKTRLSVKILDAIAKAEAQTAGNTGGTLALCLNYGGQTEIAEGVARMITEGVKADEVTPVKIAEYLYAPDIPPIDLMIRTSGEQRMSNFMLWRMAYAEMLFVADKHWPAFTVEDLDWAFADYASRQRRFGS
jgi:undecaprenyl diphosphate synthase